VHHDEELTELPEGLCALAGLEELDLRECGLTALPEGIRGLAGLKRLDLGSNVELTTLPEGLGLLRSLVHLDLYGCPGLLLESAMNTQEARPRPRAGLKYKI
jgi:Leucine-rich repeat (LRR) protein